MMTPEQHQQEISMQLESSEDSNDEIQRYMERRGCSKRHTFGCTDDLNAANAQNLEGSLQTNNSPSPNSGVTGSGAVGASGRTRRTGLLTVMERPPGMRLNNLMTIFDVFLKVLHEEFYFYLKKFVKFRIYLTFII